MNDDRPIKKLLRRYAKKRRDDAGAPIELHPATRRLLHGEVARRFPKRAATGDREAATFAQILKSWRTRWVWALPVLIVLGIGVWVLVGPSKKAGLEFDLANNTSAPTTPTELWNRSFNTLEKPESALPAPGLSFADQDAPAYSNGILAPDGPASSGVPAVASGAGPGAALDGDTLRRNQADATMVNGFAAIQEKSPALELNPGSVTATDFSPAATPRALVEDAFAFRDETTQAKDSSLSAPAKNDSLENFESVRQDFVFAGKAKLAIEPTSKPAEVAPAASPRFYRQEARGVSEREKLNASSQAFVNRAPASSYGKTISSGDRAAVLLNFQVEQTGNQLRVIDGDGSTYLGEMNLAIAGQRAAFALDRSGTERLALKREDKLAASQPVTALLAEQQEAQKFVCRVSGTNRTLNQQVVFTWNFVALTNELAAVQVKLPSAGAKVLQNNVPAQQLPLLLNNSVINGRAQLGNAKEIEINAVPVSP